MSRSMCFGVFCSSFHGIRSPLENLQLALIQWHSSAIKSSSLGELLTGRDQALAQHVDNLIHQAPHAHDADAVH